MSYRDGVDRDDTCGGSVSGYDSRRDTLAHIGEVRVLLMAVVRDFQYRASDHDRSKLIKPEKPVFDRMVPKLQELEYGSPEYMASLEEMGEALQHHYAKNRHHPEHFVDGISGMNLLDVIEMLADWKAATKRMADGGDLDESITINARRFGYGPELEGLLRNTARDMGWL